METTDSKNRTLIIGAVAGLVLAGALGAAFMFGGQIGSSEDYGAARTAVQASPTSGLPVQSTDASVSNAPQGDQQYTENPAGVPAGDGWHGEGNGGNPEGPVVSQTPVPDEDGEEEEDVPADTPTATSTPAGPDDLAAEPTPTNTPNPCPLCNDLELAVPVDYEPEISDISTSFCYPNLVVFFDLEHADAVWFTYVYDGVTHHSTHIDAGTFLGFLSEDVSALGWGALLIDNIRIHATDDEGDHTVSDELPLPELEFC